MFNLSSLLIFNYNQSIYFIFSYPQNKENISILQSTLKRKRSSTSATSLHELLNEGNVYQELYASADQKVSPINYL